MIIATCRLAPLDRVIPTARRGLENIVYDRHCFLWQEGKPLDLPVLLDHNWQKRCGTLKRIYREDGWLMGILEINQHAHAHGCVGEDIAKVGRPVSMALKPTHERQAGLLEDSKVTWIAELLEVSLATSGRTAEIRGAAITSVQRIETSQARRTQPSAVAQGTIHRRACGTITEIR